MTPADVLKWGANRPVYYWQGEIIDGRKLARSAAACGIALPMQVDFDDEEEAMHYLATVHPERALERWPCSTASEAAKRFAVPLRSIAKFFQPAPRVPRRRAARRRTGAQTRGRLGGPSMHLYISNEIRALAKERGASIGISESEYIRTAALIVTPQQVRAKLIALEIARTRKPSR